MNFLRLFFFGIIASLGAFFLELVIANTLGNIQEVLYSFFTEITPLLLAVVIIEEVFKFVFIHKSRSNLRSTLEETNDRDMIAKQIFFASIYIGLGFSLIEILIVLFGLSSSQDFSQLALSAGGIATVHVLTSAIMGYLLAKSKFVDFILIFRVLLITASLHIFYNMLVIYSASSLYVAFYLLALISFLLFMFLQVTLKRSL